MSEQKRYTALEMRQTANRFGHLASNPDCLSVHRPKDQVGDKWVYDAEAESIIQEMLRQAADAEEEIARLKTSKDRWMRYQETAAGERDACIDDLRKKDAEIAQLKARLGLS